MASNPIQRRARQSFLIGFLLALIIMAIVVVLLFTKINKLNADIAKEHVQTITVYTAISTIKSGEVINPDMLVPTTVRSELDTSKYLDSSYFYAVDEEGKEVQYVAKIEIEAGSVLTESMVRQSDKVLRNDERIMEYNMISLPSQLANHDYIDIRISFPRGESYIVLPKKYIEATTSTSIWMQMTEEDILTLSSAIVEAAQIEGARLYATKYVEPGLQEQADPTYAVNNAVLDAMNKDHNILVEAMETLKNKWEAVSGGTTLSDYSLQRNNTDGYLSGLTEDEKAAAVESSNASEDEAIRAARDAFVAAMEGTGLVGTDNY